MRRAWSPVLSLQLEELLDVGVPGLEVDAGRALAAAALVDGGDRAVEGLEPRHDAVGQTVGALDERCPCADAVPGDADAAGELREPGDVGVALVDALEAVLGRVEQIARRHLRVAGARVEQRRARREVGERRHEVVEADRLVGVWREAAGHAQEEVLRGLDDLAGLGMAQQVAVVHGAQAEELEVAVALGVDRGVERRGVGLDELQHLVADEAHRVAELNRLGEPWDVLVADLFVDVGGQQAGRQLGVVGLLDDETGRGADRQLVELARGRPVGERRDRAGRHPHRVDAEEPFGARATALTILLTSTGSRAPLRFLTRMPVGTAASWSATTPAVVSTAAPRSSVIVMFEPPTAASADREFVHLPRRSRSG